MKISLTKKQLKKLKYHDLIWVSAAKKWADKKLAPSPSELKAADYIASNLYNLLSRHFDFKNKSKIDNVLNFIWCEKWVEDICT